MQGCSKGTISIENVNVIEHVLPLYTVVVSAKIAQSSKLIFVVFQEVMLQNKIRISTEYGSFFLKAGVNKIQNTANINCFPHDIIS